MLVAAGYGTRLDPLTGELPKPALPVANRPVAWYACDHLVRSGFRDVVVNTHHLSAELRAALSAHCPAGLQLEFVHEPAILGTGGGVRNAWRAGPGEDFVVINAKLLYAPDLERALQAHRESGAIATMLLRSLPAGSTFTGIEVDQAGRVRRIGTRPSFAAPSARGGLMYTGVQILSARALADLPGSGDIIEHSYWPWLERGEYVGSVVDDSPWIDIGVTLQQYLDANLAMTRGELTWPSMTPERGGLFVDPSARLGPGSVLNNVCAGPRAAVVAGARLERVVLWEGASVEADLHDAIVTGGGQLVRLVAPNAY